MHDYLLGGPDNFAADREYVAQLLEVVPELHALAQANQACFVRLVGFLTARGFQQFLDIGSGLPHSPNVHDIAQAADPDARVVYVDIDESVAQLMRTMLADEPNTVFVHASAIDPEAIVGHLETRRTFDLSKPVAVLYRLVLETLPDITQARRAVDRMMRLMPPGSVLVIVHVTSEDIAPELVRFCRDHRGIPEPFILRTREQILSLFGQRRLLSPGLVDVQHWGVPEQSAEPLIGMRALCGIAADFTGPTTPRDLARLFERGHNQPGGGPPIPLL
jgi:hypothetical protein